MIKHFLTWQFIKFIMVGVVAAGLHWLARYGLNFYMPFVWAVALAYGVGILVAFILNALFVFPDSDKQTSKQVRDFVIINVAFFPIVWALSLIFNTTLTRLGMTAHSENLAHALAIPVPMLATFLLYKFVAFKDKSITS